MKKPKRQPRIVEDQLFSDESDSEIDEDEAFNSEDERRYGAFFNKSRDDQDDDDDEDEDESSDEDIGSDDDEEGDGGEYMLSLLDKLSSNNNNGSNEKLGENENAKLVKFKGRNTDESEFGNSSNSNQVLTMDQLMDGIQDTTGFGSLQKVLGEQQQKYSSAVTATKAPVDNAVSERAMRKVLYREKLKDMKMWDESTKAIREADTLDYRPKDKGRINRADLVSKFEPSNKFEEEMEDLLQRAGAKYDGDVLKQEQKSLLTDDDLGESGMTIEEFRKRQGELSKMRSLLFYEEQKRNKINKIKSKQYRRIRKKQNERAKGKALEAAVEADPEFAREMAEKEEMERMEERMTLTHKNTSKWAKQQLRRGVNLDKQTKQALSAQVELGNKLRKKMIGTHSDDSDDDDDRELSNKELVARARAVLEETENDADGNNGTEQKKGLHDMAFMKRGLEIQKERAKLEARKLLMELEADKSDNESLESDQDRDEEENQSSRSKLPKATSTKETAKILPKGKLVASALEFTNTETVCFNNNLSIDTGVDIEPNKSKNNNEGIALEASGKAIDKKLCSKKDPKNELEVNPWIQRTDKESTLETNEMHKKKNRASGIVNVKDAATILTLGNKSVNENMPTLKINDTIKKMENMSQAELIERAFAAPTDAEIEAEFDAEKEAERAKENNTLNSDEKNSVSGWGSWAGEGAPVPRSQKNVPKKLKAPDKKSIKPKRRLDDNLKTVIISEKRIKKNSKYCVDVVPYPYTSREQYERAMKGAIGREWNVSSAVRKMTRPDIVSRPGVIINPIATKKKVKGRRAPAKF